MKKPAADATGHVFDMDVNGLPAAAATAAAAATVAAAAAVATAAATATTAAVTAAAATTKAATASAWAFFAWACFVDDECSAVNVMSIEFFDCFVSGVIVGHFDETKAA